MGTDASAVQVAPRVRAAGAGRVAFTDVPSLVWLLPFGVMGGLLLEAIESAGEHRAPGTASSVGCADMASKP